MIEINPNLHIDDDEIVFDFVRSSGPGGQNVNKVSTAVQLRWNTIQSSVLDPQAKQRLMKLAGEKITREGVLILESKRFRTQEANKLDVIRKLTVLIQAAIIAPKVRKKTKPTVTSSAARVDEKKRRGEIKKIRSYNPDEWE